ncbi:MAG: EF-P lysine aminoacylase EpmA [Vicinamibacteria bacterium]
MNLPPSGADWKPAAPLEALRLRARFLARTREFFARRDVLEVETPAIGVSTASDPHIESIRCAVRGETRFLQTSPELFMKRLLAAGSGPIYQIAKAFRDGEVGSRHNPEFTLLEWYRPGYDHHQLMDEVDEYLQEVLGAATSTRESYGSAFERHVGLDPHRAKPSELAAKACELALPEVVRASLSREDWLNLLMAQAVEPYLGWERPQFVYDFPSELKALSRLREGVAERFELFLHGMEIANGYHELTDAAEQRARFRADLEARRVLGRPEVPPDERMLEALEHGLPASAGVALGFDRLLMVAANVASIRSVLSFPVRM